MNYFNISILIIYLAILGFIALTAAKRSKTHAGYLMGDRSLNSFTAAISAVASDMSGWLLLGLPGAVYAFGLSKTWIAVGLIIGSYCNWVFISEKIRQKSYELKAITIPDFLSKNVCATSNSIKIVSSILISLFFIIYVASGFVSGAKVLGQYFHISYQLGLLITFVAIALTTLVGGFIAVSWSEVFQGLIMIIVIVIIPSLAFMKISNLDISFTKNIIDTNPFMFDFFHNISIFEILSLMSWGLGYFGQPHILVKFIALKEANMAKNARKIATSWMIISLTFAILIGVLGAGFSSYFQGKDAELVILYLADILLHPWFIGIVIIGILSAVFSTANAQLLIIASVFTNDLNLIKKTLTMNRLMVLLMSICALLLSLNPNAKILNMVGYAWAGFGASFGPIILISLNYKIKINAHAALTGIIVGAVTVILWNILRIYLPEIKIFQFYELLPAFIMSALAILIVNNIQNNEIVKSPINK